MKVMLMTSVFIRVRNLNIFSKLFKMTSTMNNLKSNESSNMLMKQNMSISFSIITLMKTSHFLNLLWFCISELIQDNHVLYVLTFCIWSKVFFLNNFFLAESTFNILSFFHAKIEAEIAVVIIVVRIMSRASHKNTDKWRVNQINENSKLKSKIYKMQKLYVQREEKR